jgi:hypothetical protein
MSAPSDNENPTSDSNTRDPSMALAAAEAAPGEAPQNTPRTASDGDSLSTAKNQAKKREREADDDEDIILSPEKLATMSRSERKRHREKKRRSDVNKGFDDLMNLLLEIDPVVRAEAEDRARRGQWKGSLGAQEENLLSRVELIGRTVEVLRRVHTENEEHKHIIEQLLQQKSAVPKVLNLPPVREKPSPALGGVGETVMGPSLTHSVRMSLYSRLLCPRLTLRRMPLSRLLRWG